MQCELCGKKGEVRARVEGSIIQVCPACAKYGEVIHQPTTTPNKHLLKKREEVPTLNEKYNELIKQGRERKNWTQEQLAYNVKERVAYLQSIEQGKREPPMELIQKLQNTLNIDLLNNESEEFTTTKTSTSVTTLGDMAVIKRRKKQ